MKYLKVFTDFLDVTESLSDGALGRLFRAMLRYALDGREGTLRGKEGVLWAVAKQSIDRERVTYEGKVASVEAARTCLKKQKPDKSKLISDEDKDKEKENDKDNDKGKDSLSSLRAAAPVERENRPTLQEAIQFSEEEGLQMDVPYFYHYYEANGWHIGKQPVRDWRAAMRAWARKPQGRVPHKPSVRDAFLAAMEQARWEEAQQI